MRRPASLPLGSVVVLAAALLVAGCGGGKTVAPLPETVVGPLPKAAAPPKGDPQAGRAVYLSSGCGGCHTFKPAGKNGTIGPDLDNLAADAKKANQGSLDDYTRASIVDPNAYIVPGFQAGVMPGTYGTQLSAREISDLVAFLTQKG